MTTECECGQVERWENAEFLPVPPWFAELVAALVAQHGEAT